MAALVATTHHALHAVQPSPSTTATTQKERIAELYDNLTDDASVSLNTLRMYHPHFCMGHDDMHRAITEMRARTTPTPEAECAQRRVFVHAILQRMSNIMHGQSPQTMKERAFELAWTVLNSTLTPATAMAILDDARVASTDYYVSTTCAMLIEMLNE